MGDGVDAEPVGKFVIGIAVLKPGHLVLGDEILPFIFVGVPADADDDEGLASKLLGDLFHLWKFFFAGTAPGGPEVDEDYTASHGVEVEVSAVKGYDLKCGRHLEVESAGFSAKCWARR